MKLDLALPSDISIALRRFAHEQDVDLSAAAALALRDWLTGHGYLETDDMDEDSEVAGNA